MEKLDSIHKKDLSREDFEGFPVWVWDDEQEGHHPLVGSGPMPFEFGTLFVRTRFVPVSGPSIFGYSVGLRSFYAFGLFVDDEHYVVNRNAPDLAEPVFRSIAPTFGIPDVMPMRYICDVFDGQLIEGTLEF